MHVTASAKSIFRCVAEFKNKCKSMKDSQKVNQVELGHLLNNKERRLEVRATIARSKGLPEHSLDSK